MTMEVGFKTQDLNSPYEEDDFMEESPENSTMFLSRSFEKNEMVGLIPTFIRGETPDTIISDRVWYPDLNLYCGCCQEFVFVEDLPSHRKMHRYMDDLEMEIGRDQPSFEELTSKRNKAVNRLRSKKIDKLSAVQHLNVAFDYLTKYFHSKPCHHYDLPIPKKEINTDAVFSKGLLCSLASGIGVGAASYQNPEFRQRMEDTMVYQDCFGQDPRKCYMAVFNGYHGNFAAQLAADELHHALLCEMQRFDPYTTCSCAYNMIEGHRIAALEIHRPRTRASDRVALHSASHNLIEQIIHTCEERLDEVAASAADRMTPLSAALEDGSNVESSELFALKMTSAFNKSFFYTDSLLRRGQDSYSTVRWSGCGATCLLFRELEDPTPPAKGGPSELAKVYVANAGASHAVLLRNNRHFRLTQSHIPSRRKERKRVQEKGGSVSLSRREPLVNGVLPYSRGLGSHGDVALKRCVIANPYTVAVPLDERCQALVVATPGLWKVLTEEEVMGLLIAELPCNRSEPPSTMSVDSLLGRRRPTTRATTAATTAFGTTPGPPETELTCSPRFIDVDDLSSGHEADVDTDIGETPTLSMDAGTPAVGLASQTAEHLARKLVQAALLAGTTENVAVQVALFPAAFSANWTMISVPSRRTETLK